MNSPRTFTDLLELRLTDARAAARWDEIVRCSPQSDVYHRAAYVLATAEVEQSQPLG
jgi:hypothetical protein